MHETVGAGTQGAQAAFVRLAAGHHEDAELRPARAQARNHLDAAEDGDHQVDDQQVGLHGAGRRERGAAVVVTGHDFELVVHLEQVFQGDRDHGVVVDDDDANHAGVLDK